MNNSLEPVWAHEKRKTKKTTTFLNYEFSNGLFIFKFIFHWIYFKKIYNFIVCESFKFKILAYQKIPASFWIKYLIISTFSYKISAASTKI